MKQFSVIIVANRADAKAKELLRQIANLVWRCDVIAALVALCLIRIGFLEPRVSTRGLGV